MSAYDLGAPNEQQQQQHQRRKRTICTATRHTHTEREKRVRLWAGENSLEIIEMENDCNSVAVASNSGGTHSRDASNSPGLEGRDECRGGKTLKTKHQDWRHSMVLTYQKTSLFSGPGSCTVEGLGAIFFQRGFPPTSSQGRCCRLPPSGSIFPVLFSLAFKPRTLSLVSSASTRDTETSSDGGND